MKKQFTNRFNAPRLTPEQAARQGRASALAFEKLGQAKAIAFLNGDSEALAGRPIDIAIASADGLLAVESIINSLAAD